MRGREDNFYTTTSPRLALNYKHYPENALFHNQAAFNDAFNDADNREIYNSRTRDRELPEVIQNDADIASVNTHTQDAAYKVINNTKRNESDIPGATRHKLGEKMHVSHNNNKLSKNKKKGGRKKLISPLSLLIAGPI